MQAIDFFCGGGGMTFGLRQAGVQVVAGSDFDRKQSFMFVHTMLNIP